LNHPEALCWLIIVSQAPTSDSHHSPSRSIPSSSSPASSLFLSQDMGNVFSHSGQHSDSGTAAATLKRQPSDNAGAAGLKQSISQNMRLSKSKVTALLKANHMNYSIVHRNHFYNTLPHVTLLCCDLMTAHWLSVPLRCSSPAVIRRF
jgi:hypothetical protein